MLTRWEKARMYRGVCFIALILLAGLSDAAPAGADEEVARFLLGQAKKALSTRKFDEAVTKLERAREEDPDLLEAAYVLGQVYEKKKEPAKALGAYRAFRDGCRIKGAELDVKLARLLKRASKRIAVLGKGEVALEKLQRAFCGNLLKFATRQQKEDPDIAVDALRRVLAVAPEHAAARTLLDELVGADDATTSDGGVDPRTVPIRGIKVWDDLLVHRAIPAGKRTSYKGKVLTIDNQGGTIYWTDPYKRAPETFVYEMEFRFVKDHANGYLLGLAFGLDRESGGEDFVMAFAQRSQATIVHASNGKQIDIAETATKPNGYGVWKRFTVAVEGRKVRVRLDGKQILNASVPGRKQLSGPIGIFHQRCAAEIRMLRLGTKE